MNQINGLFITYLNRTINMDDPEQVKLVVNDNNAEHDPRTGVQTKLTPDERKTLEPYAEKLGLTIQ